MRLRCAAFIAALALPAGRAFTCAPHQAPPLRSPLAALQSSRDDVDDDWHADYDPSQYSDRAASYDSFNDRPPQRRGRGGGGRGGGRGGRGGRGRGGYNKPKPYLGPNGHDYQLSSDAGPNASRLNEDDIHALLKERLQAKFARDFHTADAIQMELIDGGVFVNDKLKEWRADGVPYGSFQGGDRGGQRGRRENNQRYEKSPHSADVAGASDSLIDKLVGERTKFKMMREYTKADAVREGLRTKFDVLIDDRLRQWSAGGDFGAEHNAQRELADKFANRGYIKSASSLSLEDEEEEEYIQHHVDARAQAKKERNFEAADKIRLDLAQRFDVTINDKQKLWSVGGVFEELGGKMGRPKGVYVRRGGGELTAEEEEAIAKLITDRYHAKKQKNYSAADDIRDELMRTYNVKLDDRSNEWRVETDEYAMTGDNKLSDEEKEHIDGRLRERFALKMERAYEDADTIRDELWEKFVVRVDDRTKEWFVEGGVGAAEESLESLAV